MRWENNFYYSPNFVISNQKMIWDFEWPDIYVFSFYIYFSPENYAPYTFLHTKLLLFSGGRGGGRTPLFTTTCLLARFARLRKNAILPPRHNYPSSPDKSSSQINVASFASVPSANDACFTLLPFCNFL